MSEKWITVAEMAEKEGLTSGAILHRAKRGTIKTKKVGKVRWVMYANGAETTRPYKRALNKRDAVAVEHIREIATELHGHQTITLELNDLLRLAQIGLRTLLERGEA